MKKRDAVGLRLIAQLLAVAVITSTLLAFGVLQWPGLHWDATYYAPPILNVAAADEWISPSYLTAMLAKGNDRYDSHGVLHILLYGKLLKAATWDTLFLWYAVINAITFLAWYIIYWRALGKGIAENPLWAIPYAAVPAVIAIGLQGRPEQLLPLLSSFPVYLWLTDSSERTRLNAAYLTAPLIFTVSPLPGVIIAATTIGYQWQRFGLNTWTLFREASFFSVIWIGCVSIIVGALSPAELLPWMKSLTESSQRIAVPHLQFLRFPQSLLGDTLVAPVWGAVILGAKISFGIILWRKKQFLLVAALIGITLYLSGKILDYGYVWTLPSLMALWMKHTQHQRRLCEPILLRSLFNTWGPRVVGMFYITVIVQLALVVQDIGSGPGSLPYLRNVVAKLSQANGVASSRLVLGYQSVGRPSLVVLEDECCRTVGHLDPATLTGEERLRLYENMYNIPVRFVVVARSGYDRNSTPSAYKTIGASTYRLVASALSSGPKDWRDRVWPRSLGRDYSAVIYERVPKISEGETQ